LPTQTAKMADQRKKIAENRINKIAALAAGKVGWNE
jgi:hypothetical protein